MILTSLPASNLGEMERRAAHMGQWDWDVGFCPSDPSRVDDLKNRTGSSNLLFVILKRPPEARCL